MSFVAPNPINRLKQPWPAAIKRNEPTCMAWRSPFTGSIPRSWSVSSVSTRSGRRDEEVYNPNYCTYRGVRWSRAMLKFIVEEVGVPAHRISQVAETAIVNLNVTTNLRPKVQYLGAELNLSRAELGRLVGAFPGALGLSVTENIQPTLDYLRARIPLSRDEVGHVVLRYPQLLGLSMANNVEPKLKFLVDEMHVPRHKIRALVLRQPAVLGISTELHLRPLLSFLRQDLSLPPEGVGHVVVTCPMLLSCSIEGNLRPSLAALSSLSAIPRHSFGPLLLKYPSLLCLNVANNVEPKVQLLRHYNLSRPAIRAIITANPNALGVSMQRYKAIWERLRSEGLTPPEIRKMLTRHPRVLTHSSSDKIGASFDALSRGLALSPAAVRRAVVSSPHLLTVKFNRQHANKIVSALVTVGGFSEMAARTLLRKRPLLATADVVTRLKPFLRFLRGTLGMTPAQVQSTLSRNPTMVSLSLERKVSPRIAFLRDEVGIPACELGLAVSRAPSLLALSRTRTLRPALAFLRSNLKIPETRLPQMLVRAPSLLYSRASTLQQVVDFLREEVGIPDHRLPLLLASQPQLLMSSLDGKLRPGVNRITETLELAPEQARKIISSHPTILGLHPDTLQAKVSFLEESLNASRPEVGAMAATFPALLTLSVDRNLAPKIAFLTQEMKLPPAVLVRSPQLLAFSLARRIRPRFAALSSRGAALTVPPRTVLAASDHDFRRRFLEVTPPAEPGDDEQAGTGADTVNSTKASK